MLINILISSAKHILIYEYLDYFINTNRSTSDRLNLEYAKISTK